MKKKSPPYAIIGAAILGIIAIVAIIQWQKMQDAEKAKAIADAQAKAQAAIDAANAGHQTQVVETDTTKMRAVLYATQPVEPGIKISPALYEIKQTPVGILPDAYTDQTDVTGWFAVRGIEKGDPLTPRNVGKTLPYLSLRIPPGMREIALPIFNAEMNDTGGYIVDGDRVDLLYTTSADGTAIKVEMVMQNLLILSVPGSPVKTEKTEGINPVPPPGDPISVTFEVTPEQAEALIFLAGQAKTGRFSMILRGRRDQVVAKVKPFEAADYESGLKKVQKVVDKSNDRVAQLAAQIEAQEKHQAGNTNETPNPTPPSQ